jgi:NADH-quinone oxidoreductase subunit J
MGSIDPVFAIAAALTVGAGLLVVTQRNPIYSAISMLVCFLGLAVIYLRLLAPFLAAIHVLVYTGAILVLFLFVIMLLNLKPEELGGEYPLKVRGFIAAMCAGLFALIALPLWQDQRKFPDPPAPTEHGAFGSVEQVGHALFVDYALPFELISVLIMVAVFGGVLLAKKKL